MADKVRSEEFKGGEAALQANHKAALSASDAMRDGNLSKVQIATAILSFRKEKLDGFADALEKQSKASDPVQGWRIAADDIHKARQGLNQRVEQVQDSARAVKAEDILVGASAAIKDPKMWAQARRDANEAIAAAASPQAQADGKILDDLMRDPKTQAGLKERGSKIAKDTGINVSKLPAATREFIEGKAGEQIGNQQAEILELYKRNGADVARAKMLDAAEQGMKQGIKEIQSGVRPDPSQGRPSEVPARVPTPEELKKRIQGANVPSPAEAEARAQGAATAGAAAKIDEIIKGHSAKAPSVADVTAMMKAENNPKAIVAGLMSGPEFTTALESRYAHIKQVTGRDPKALPPQELASAKIKMGQEALSDAPRIAQINKDKGPAAARAEIASHGEALIIAHIDHLKANPPQPAPKAEVQSPAAGQELARQAQQDAARKLMEAMGRKP